MPVRSDNPSAGQWTFWKVCISALLIGLILYNPFFGISNHSGGLNYQALARHRATVGACEMQHFTPVQGVEAQPIGLLEERSIRVAVETEECPSGNFPEEALPQQVVLAASIWFRPPPSE